MDILQRHTAQHFGTMQHGIKRSGKVIYTARGGANSDLGLTQTGGKCSDPSTTAQNSSPA